MNRRIVALKLVRTFPALLACAAVCMSSAAQAPDEPSFEELAGSNPCPRWDAEFREDTGIKVGERKKEILYTGVLAWADSAWTRICMESARSDAVALAWAQGLDEHGVLLTANDRARKLAEMEGWLRGLIGKFRIEGRRWNDGAREFQVSGTADCFGIGSGPGVSCVISADWKPDEQAGKGKNQTAANPAIRPQVLLFGIDPVAMEIRVTHVDSIAVELHGFLRDGAVVLKERSPPQVWHFISTKFAGRCWSGPGTCYENVPYLTSLSRLSMDSDGNFPRRLSRIATTQGGGIDMKFHVFTLSRFNVNANPPLEFDLQLHREPLVTALETGPVVAPGFTCARPVGSGKTRMLDEPQELPADAMKESGTRQMQAWLARLVGQYTVEGYVDPCGQGDPEDQRPVSGEVDCIAAGSPASVHCNVNISWPPATSVNDRPAPGGVSHLASAQFLFSVYSKEGYQYSNFAPFGGADQRGLYFLQLDNREIAEWDASELVGDTFMSRRDCFEKLDNCKKTTRITARPDSNEITIEVGIEAGRSQVRQVFVLRRKSGPQQN